MTPKKFPGAGKAAQWAVGQFVSESGAPVAEWLNEPLSERLGRRRQGAQRASGLPPGQSVTEGLTWEMPSLD